MFQVFIKLLYCFDHKYIFHFKMVEVVCMVGLIGDMITGDNKIMRYVGEDKIMITVDEN